MIYTIKDGIFKREEGKILQGTYICKSPLNTYIYATSVLPVSLHS